MTLYVVLWHHPDALRLLHVGQQSRVLRRSGVKV